jgi:hypothetical protein
MGLVLLIGEMRNEWKNLEGTLLRVELSYNPRVGKRLG